MSSMGCPRELGMEERAEAWSGQSKWIKELRAGSPEHLVLNGENKMVKWQYDLRDDVCDWCYHGISSHHHPGDFWCLF